jgi:4-amino-4-deoxy-L-arabinose transferase-like glycosyltransferase
MFFHRLSESPLGGDDCYYSEVAKEMARTGDYLTPHNAYRVDFHTSKPPMLYWMNALSGKVFGFNTFAMRVPSAVLSFIGIIALLFFVDRYFGYTAAFFSAVILAFTQQYLYHARSAVTDGPFAVFFALAMMSFWVARAEKKSIYFYITGVFIGLAVMTRQLPGLFIPAAILVYILVSREFYILKNPNFYAGMMLSAVIFLPWHVVMYLKHGQFFLDQYFRVALITGIKGYPVAYSGNPSLNPWYAYFSILLSNYWPWLPFMLAGLYKAVKGYAGFEPEYKKKINYVLCWIFVPLIIFQAAAVKQYHYILPLYAPFAIVAALAFDGFKQAAKSRAIWILVAVVSFYTMSCLLFPIIPRTLDSREYSDTITLIPEIKKLDGNITTLHVHGMHYYSCFWFYGDKNTVFDTEEGIISKLSGKDRYYFVMENSEFAKIVSKTKNVRIIKHTRDSVLFTGA